MTNDRVTVQHKAVAHLRRWQVAISLQAGRICEPVPPEPVGETPVPDVELDQEADAFLFVLALRNVLRAAELISWTAEGTEAHREVGQALAAFRRTVPDLKDIRDVVEHFDEYEQGQGRLRRKLRKTRGEDAPAWPAHFRVEASDEGRVVLVVMPGDGHRWTLDVRSAAEAAGTLFTAIVDALIATGPTPPDQDA